MRLPIPHSFSEGDEWVCGSVDLAKYFFRLHIQPTILFPQIKCNRLWIFAVSGPDFAYYLVPIADFIPMVHWNSFNILTNFRSTVGQMLDEWSVETISTPFSVFKNKVLLMISLLRSGIFLMSHSCGRFPFETKFHRFRVCQKCLWIDEFGDTCHGNAASRWSLNFTFGLSKKYLPIDVFGSKFLGIGGFPQPHSTPSPQSFSALQWLCIFSCTILLFILPKGISN